MSDSPGEDRPSRWVFRALAPAAAALLALASAPAPAQESEASAGATAEIAGSWAFETQLYDVGCVMVGELELQTTDQPGEYVGQLVARETCRGGRAYTAEQTVTAHRDGGQLVIRATIDKVEPLPVYPATYEPDNFGLAIMNGSLMVGELRSARIALATFRRRPGLVS